MKILSFAASNSPKSINRELLKFAQEFCKTKFSHQFDFETLDLNDFEMPIYRSDREEINGIPEQAKLFFEKIGQADALLISFAEHNGSVTAAWKNIFDWMSRINSKVWQDKPMVILAASPGGRAGANVLNSQVQLAPFYGGNIKAQLGIGKWYEAWDAGNKRLNHAQDIVSLEKALAEFLTL